jgi:hypothetical protein
MIDISEVRSLEKTATIERVNREREKAENNRKAQISSMSRAKKIAEEQFPTELNNIEVGIKERITSNGTGLTYYINYKDDTVIMFLQIMLVQALFLKGFPCKFYSNDRIIISW